MGKPLIFFVKYETINMWIGLAAETLELLPGFHTLQIREIRLRGLL
jgi:hypothetical protein